MDIEKLRQRVIKERTKNEWTYRRMSEISGIHSSVLQKQHQKSYLYKDEDDG